MNTKVLNTMFPKSALVGSLGDLAITLAKGTEVPEEFCFAAGLTAFGHMCGADLTLEIGFDVETRLYTVLLGESYEVKKSTAMKKVIEFFKGVRANRMGQERSLSVVHGVGSAEGLVKALEDSPRTLLVYDELKALVDKFEVQGATLLAMITSLFEGNCWENKTKKDAHSFSVKNAQISLMGCATRQTYANMWKREAISIGLPNRLFVVNGDRRDKVAWPEPPDENQLAQIARRVESQLRRLPVKMKITSEGQHVWADWYQSVGSSQHAKRLDTIGFRLTSIDRIDN